MRVVVVGLSHRTAPVELREKLSLYGRSTGEALNSLLSASHFDECAIISTCNRTEIYGAARSEDWLEPVLELMAAQAGVNPGKLQDHLFSFEGTPAARHLFRVAAGLDSMVVGEGQILAQVKDALVAAQSAGTAGTMMHGLFQHAIGAGKRARSETEIGRGAVSISLAAVHLAKQIFQRLKDRTVLLLGAGETAEQTAKMLIAEAGSPRLLVCNRTLGRAQDLAGQFGGSVLAWENLSTGLATADIVITSTGAPEPVISVDLLRAAMRARRGRALFLIDIAVPRDVDPQASKLDDVYLYNIDDLQSVVASSLAGRQSEIARVESLLEEDLARFQTWVSGLSVGPTIRQLQEFGRGILDSELNRVGGRLSHLSERDREVVNTLLQGVVNKLLRPSILHLRSAAETGSGYHEIEHVRAVFGLESPGAISDPADQASKEPG